MVDSPCVKICELNEDDVCVGCGRSRAEIAGWTSAPDAKKAQIVEIAKKRKKGARRGSAGAGRTAERQRL